MPRLVFSGAYRIYEVCVGGNKKKGQKIACERDWGLVPGCGVGGVICWVAIFFIYFLGGGTCSVLGRSR